MKISSLTDSVNIGDHLLATGRPEDPVITDPRGTHTYAELRSAVARLSRSLQEADLSPGSRVGLLGANSLYWVASYLAIIRSGHTVVPFATVLTAEDVEAKAEFVGCDTLFLDSRLGRRFERVTGWMRSLVTEEALGDGEAEELAAVPVAAPATDAVLLFTSGTTGRPRAVRVTHGNIRANTESIIEYLGLARHDRMLVVLPFSYCYGASLLHTHLRAGGSLCVCDTLAFPESVVAMMRAERCTGFAGVPSTYQLLLRASSFASTSLPALRHMQQAGGRLPHSQILEVSAAHPGARLFVMYGATEATARLSYLPPEDIEARAGSIGRGIPGVTLRVTDEIGRDLDPGDVGEVRARGENITAGYWQDPVGTAAKYVDGELRTGDMARMDEDGYVYIVDRQDDFIKSWGFRVSSHEVADAILTMPEIVSAAVVGRPDPDAGEAIVAFCTPRRDAAITSVDVMSHCRGRLAKHLVPHEVFFIPQLPLNANGKVMKSTLRAMAASEGREPER
ncbi:MAG: class I adenylate-forming enzyme family protein [Dermatophilaceae bacterium]